ncbi:MAG: DNA-processing protein DprA [Sedimentisphaerales bacterium]|nr:DNA-processing protein DprA [Sedimentisphaerales bacterium]
MSQSGPDPTVVAQWLRLHLAAGVGSKTFARLLQYFGRIEAVLAATAGQLSSVPGIGRKTAERIARGRDEAEVDKELALAEKLGVHILTWESADYPKLLGEIPDPPPVLYVKGQFARSDCLALAMVGSRNCSAYGQEQAARLSHLLAAAGFTIVSGLARGIDTAAHRGALGAEGRTIAVQGCGLSGVFPPENRDLARQIADGRGAVISELPLTFEPLATTFPARNRIISGLTLGTIVVEARRNSGAMITARLALEQNREVMAVPGRIDAPGSFGPHQLIKDGAKLVERIEDVLDALGPIGQSLGDHAAEQAGRAEALIQPALFDAVGPALSPDESRINDCFDQEPIHVEQIIERTGLPPGTVHATLTALQLKGALKQLPGSYYQKRPRK